MNSNLHPGHRPLDNLAVDVSSPVETNVQKEIGRVKRKAVCRAAQRARLVAARRSREVTFRAQAKAKVEHTKGCKGASRKKAMARAKEDAKEPLIREEIAKLRSASSRQHVAARENQRQEEEEAQRRQHEEEWEKDRLTRQRRREESALIAHKQRDSVDVTRISFPAICGTGKSRSNAVGKSHAKEPSWSPGSLSAADAARLHVLLQARLGPHHKRLTDSALSVILSQARRDSKCGRAAACLVLSPPCCSTNLVHQARNGPDGPSCPTPSEFSELIHNTESAELTATPLQVTAASEGLQGRAAVRWVVNGTRKANRDLAHAALCAHQTAVLEGGGNCGSSSKAVEPVLPTGDAVVMSMGVGAQGHTEQSQGGNVSGGGWQAEMAHAPPSSPLHPGSQNHDANKDLRVEEEKAHAMAGELQGEESCNAGESAPWNRAGDAVFVHQKLEKSFEKGGSASSKVNEHLEQAMNKDEHDATERIREDEHDATERIREDEHDATERIREDEHDATERIREDEHDATERIREDEHDATERIREGEHDATERIREDEHDATERFRAEAEDVEEQSRESVGKEGESKQEVEENTKRNARVEDAAEAVEGGTRARAREDHDGSDQGMSDEGEDGAGGGVYSGVGDASASSPPSEQHRSHEHSRMHEAGLRRLGLNAQEVMRVLKGPKMWDSVHAEAPMRVVRFQDFKEFQGIPRSSDNKTVLLPEVSDCKIIFISHRWLRPWHSEEACKHNGHEWGGMAHPDDHKGTKHKLICAAVEQLCKMKGWDPVKVCIWIDFCGVEQDDAAKLGHGVASLRGYITVCDAVIIPSPEVPPEGAETIELIPGEYGERGWTRLEAMSFYAISTLRQVEAPEIWVAAGKGAAFFQRFSYILAELPSKGVLFAEGDRAYIEKHEETFLEQLRATVVRKGYITKHENWVHCVAFHPIEEGLVASCDEDGKIKLVDGSTGTVRREFVGHKGAVNSIAFSRDGARLTSGGDDMTVRVWDVAKGQQVTAALKGHAFRVTSVAFSPDGMTVASGSLDKTLRIWDSFAGGSSLLTMEGHTDEIKCVAYHPGGRLVASGSEDTTVMLWDVSSGGPVRTFRGHTDYVTSVAFSPDGKTLASGGGKLDKTVRLWHVDGGDGETLGSSGNDASAGSVNDASAGSVNDASAGSVNDASTAGTLIRVLGTHNSTVRCIAWAPDGRTLASGSEDIAVLIWDVLEEPAHHAGSQAGAAGGGSLWRRKLDGHNSSVFSVSFSANGRTLASGSKDCTVRLWDVTEEDCSHGSPRGGGAGAAVTGMILSADGKTLVSCDWKGVIIVWDVETGSLVRALEGDSASWRDLGPKVEALVQQVKQAARTFDRKAIKEIHVGSYIVSAPALNEQNDMVYLHWGDWTPSANASGAQLNEELEKQALASFPMPKQRLFIGLQGPNRVCGML